MTITSRFRALAASEAPRIRPEKKVLPMSATTIPREFVTPVVMLRARMLDR
jgi:hypothetical protein